MYEKKVILRGDLKVSFLYDDDGNYMSTMYTLEDMFELIDTGEVILNELKEKADK